MLTPPAALSHTVRIGLDGPQGIFPRMTAREVSSTAANGAASTFAVPRHLRQGAPLGTTDVGSIE